ncbi:hypothetical protein Acid345_1072 [Candidatus Koribacter versatilis Ellin345]|uniref:DUF2059 domain-containing protein n=1 Tax=Koribacter versatilis (strain Ellin345) TaxID=204669 RepID=Q1ISS5_KORVE|nr:DUF2059 domain-containing protein [Candidatus Koribacter versatilis]ABF40075.1 hypothetical protein Acid345_1072 [Candidatus Koribacter versatilis Ellin345]
MKRAALLVVLLSALVSANSQETKPDQPTRDDLTKMFEVLRVRQQTEGVMKTMLAQMKQQIEGDIEKRYPNLSEESKQKIEKMVNDSVNLYPVSEMLDDLTPVYQKHLTKADVDAIVGFYSSAAGQHFLDQMPTMTQEAMQLMLAKLQTRTAEYAKKIQDQADSLAEPKKP